MAVLKWLSGKSFGYSAPTSHDKEEGPYERFLTVFGLLCNTITSTTTLVGLENHWTIRGHLYGEISNARATTQIVVRIIADFLGSLYIHTICQLVSFYPRIAYARYLLTG